MANTDEILRQAARRAQEMGLPYAGAVTPAEAFDLLKNRPDAQLIDVRSRAELDFVGRVPGSVAVEWKSYPGMVANPLFMQQLREQVGSDAVAMFICRSGARS